MLSQRLNKILHSASRRLRSRYKLQGSTLCGCRSTVSIMTSSKCRGPLKPGPSLKDFISPPISETVNIESDVPPYLDPMDVQSSNRYVFFEVYGCQMNVNDTEIVWSILKSTGYLKTEDIWKADVVLLMTCSIRDNAEKKIWHRLKELRAMKRKRWDDSSVKIGLLGCMAERLKHRLLEEDRLVDVVAGPDSYKDLPRLLAISSSNETAINVMLSQDETYADITPVRLNPNSVSAYVSIMRGCNNMCTYCIVPFTRGRERSRPVSSIVKEIEYLSENGVKEVTLLGQNVNSYRDTLIEEHNITNEVTKMAKGFKTVYKPTKGGLRFAQLLDQVAAVDSQMRIRYTSPHPKDFPDEVLRVIADRSNVCANIHLPAQSGNTNVLERMRRGYTREAYVDLVCHIRQVLPGVTLSSDFICGFCGETEDEFEDTLTLIDEIGYNVAYLFAYSMREKTTAHRRFVDDVPETVKRDRMIRMSKVFRQRADQLNQKYIGKNEIVLIEGASKRSKEFLAGRNDGNIKTIIPIGELPVQEHSVDKKPIQVGDYVMVHITYANSQILKGQPLYHCSIP